MVFRKLCPPALIYLIFSITQVGIDTTQGMYNMAFVKLWVALIFTILLNFLCVHGLGVISWIIVFVPFILMTIIVSMLLVMFGLNPATGRTKSYTPKKKHRRHYYDSGSYYGDYSGGSSGGSSGGAGSAERGPKDESPMAHYDERQRRYYERQHEGRHSGRHHRHHDDRHRGGHHENRHRDDRDEELSGPQKHVLDDMVQQRTSLSRDPLHR